MLLKLGSISLDALLVSGLSDDESWNYAEHPTIEELPVLQFLGPEGRQIGIEVRVHPSLDGSASVRTQVAAAASSGTVLPLQTGNGALLGWFVVTSVGTRRNWTLPDGTLVDGSLSISLRESRPGDATDVPLLGVEAHASPVRVEPDLVDTDRDPAEVPLSEIVRHG